MDVAQGIMLWLCLVFLAVIAWRDFLTSRIRNRDVLVMIVLVSILLLLRGMQGPLTGLLPDVLAGTLLFALGFVMWLAGAMGAGDVKLYFPLGMLVGWALLPVYVVFLLLASVVMLVAIQMARRFPHEGGRLRGRLTEIALSRKVPYAPPMAIAATLTLLPQALGLYPFGSFTG
jgi:prepilin peptidase CpaA